ncbi:MAG TPA: hypothetical protein VK211_12240 [Kamptonema sp.]|nr:hypothetical protein [Kamptonema sp.]
MAVSNATLNSREKQGSPWGIYWAKASAILALVNFLLVIFNFSYIQLRPVYLRYLPSVVTVYDPIKGLDSNMLTVQSIKPIDSFWKIDIFFMFFFAVDLFGGTFILSRSKPGLSWLGALLRRWYEVFLLIPIWQGWRILPVLVRLHKSRLVNLNQIVAQITYEPVAYLGDTLSEYIMVRLINQAQSSLEKGEAAKLLLQQQPYLHVNQINTVEQIASRILELTVYKVLPRVQPHLEELLHHNLEGAIKQSDFYKILQGFSPINILPAEVMEQLANYLAQTAVDVVSTTYEDGRGRELIDGISQEFKEALRKELQDENTLLEIQSLLSDFLEEVKLNYIQGALKSDPEETLIEIAKLRQLG